MCENQASQKEGIYRRKQKSNSKSKIFEDVKDQQGASGLSRRTTHRDTEILSLC